MVLTSWVESDAFCCLEYLFTYRSAVQQNLNSIKGDFSSRCNIQFISIYHINWIQKKNNNIKVSKCSLQDRYWLGCFTGAVFDSQCLPHIRMHPWAPILTPYLFLPHLYLNSQLTHWRKSKRLNKHMFPFISTYYRPGPPGRREHTWSRRCRRWRSCPPPHSGGPGSQPGTQGHTHTHWADSTVLDLYLCICSITWTISQVVTLVFTNL